MGLKKGFKIIIAYLHIIDNLLKKAAKGWTLFVKALNGLHICFELDHTQLHGKCRMIFSKNLNVNKTQLCWVQLGDSKSQLLLKGRKACSLRCCCCWLLHASWVARKTRQNAERPPLSSTAAAAHAPPLYHTTNSRIFSDFVLRLRKPFHGESV